MSAVTAFFIPRTCGARLVPDSIDVLTGYGQANLKFQPETYRMNPFFASFNYDVTGHPLLQFSVEPFYSRGFSPDNSFEAGTNIALQFTVIPSSLIRPYVRLAFGGMYFSQKTVSQHNGLNFNEYAGVGAHMFAGSPVNLIAEFRLRHISNADFASPNIGINTRLFLCGVRVNF